MFIKLYFHTIIMHVFYKFKNNFVKLYSNRPYKMNIICCIASIKYGNIVWKKWTTVKTNPKPSVKSIPDEWICISIRSWTWRQHADIRRIATGPSCPSEIFRQSCPSCSTACPVHLSAGTLRSISCEAKKTNRLIYWCTIYYGNVLSVIIILYFAAMDNNVNADETENLTRDYVAGRGYMRIEISLEEQKLFYVIRFKVKNKKGVLLLT